MSRAREEALMSRAREEPVALMSRAHEEPVALMSRAPAAHPETTGSRALENIDSKDTGRVARQQAVS
jgi:hypothetical protein